MHHFYESIETGAVILVYASNAFNSLNRQTPLRNIHHLCPSLSKVPINTYREDIQLFVDKETLLSQEGTTQRDPLAMAMYVIVITPLMHHLEDEETKHVWFADDVTAGGSLAGLKTWWDCIIDIGPEYGYHPNASNTCLILKEETLEEATTMFEGTGVAITAEGRRHLGAAIGTHNLLKDTSNRRFLHGHMKLIACPPSP